MSEDKYMRASKRLLEILRTGATNGMCGGDEILFCADVLRAEIERPEPLVPGVRYKNTEANFNRIPMDGDRTIIVNVFWNNSNMIHAAYYGNKVYWRTAEGSRLLRPDAFALIPDGEVQDE
ncbi:MAG: hypothetical protein M0Q91_12195 [Methanoregula sp.]|jgi:hypothetical protein|nr:hypothetical protein [Methanoregula sp.]